MPEINFNCPLQPVGDRIIVQQDAAEEVTKGGLIIPDTAQEKPQFATIIRVGAGRGIDNDILKMLTSLIKGLRWIISKLGLDTDVIRQWCDEHLPLNEKSVIIYKPGMRVLIGRYAGTEIEYKEVKYLMIRMSDIAAIVEEDGIQ